MDLGRGPCVLEGNMRPTPLIVMLRHTAGKPPFDLGVILKQLSALDGPKYSVYEGGVGRSIFASEERAVSSKPIPKVPKDLVLHPTSVMIDITVFIGSRV